MSIYPLYDMWHGTPGGVMLAMRRSHGDAYILFEDLDGVRRAHPVSVGCVLALATQFGVKEWEPGPMKPEKYVGRQVHWPSKEEIHAFVERMPPEYTVRVDGNVDSTFLIFQDCGETCHDKMG